MKEVIMMKVLMRMVKAILKRTGMIVQPNLQRKQVPAKNPVKLRRLITLRLKVVLEIFCSTVCWQVRAKAERIIQIRKVEQMIAKKAQKKTCI